VRQPAPGRHRDGGERLHPPLDGAFGYYASMAVLSVSVGYSVCCFMVVMGWLSHEQDLFSWIQLRLVWTAFGILMALLSLRLVWPARARIQQRQGLQQLLLEVGHTLESDATGRTAPQEHPQRWLEAELRQLRRSLLSLGDQRQAALLELGPLASLHPHARLWALLDQACEQLILDLDDLRRQPPADWHVGTGAIQTRRRAFLQGWASGPPLGGAAGGRRSARASRQPWPWQRSSPQRWRRAVGT
jgi:hypothetical protein